MDQLAGTLANDVHPQQRVSVQVEDQLQQAGGVADDLPARDLAVVGFAHFVRHALLGQLFFVAANG